MNPIFDTLCLLHEDARYKEDYDHYNSLSDKERLYIKSSIAFAYEYYQSQYTSIQAFTKAYSMCTVDFQKKLPPYLLFLLPASISIPPMVSLLLPGQILSIPIIVVFDGIPSAHVMTAVELVGVEDIFIGCGDSFIQHMVNYEHGMVVTSSDYRISHSIFHYSPPVLPREASQYAVMQWLYSDAQYEDIYKAHVSHIKEENLLQLWVYPAITLDCYYDIDYRMR